MKTSKAYFNRFKKEFLRWQSLLGLMQYRIVFKHEFLDGNFATLCISEMGKLAEVKLTTIIGEESIDDGPESHAKHEAIHLLLNRLWDLGTSRYVMPEDLPEECEAIVCRLEKVLK